MTLINTELFNEMIGKLPFSLSGEWIKRNSAYEAGLCSEIGWKLEENRYFDAKYKDLNIEIKKGRSIWLDLVRYSEIVLNIGVQDTITAFFIPTADKEHIEKILFAYTNDIIRVLRINEALAHKIVDLNNNTPRSLNCQASLTVRDLSEIAFHIKHFTV